MRGRTGDISSLQVDAIVNSTNESMNDDNSVSNRIFQRAGFGLKEEIALEVRGNQFSRFEKMLVFLLLIF